MFKHLLVPLDGSRLAEAALPAAAFLAEKLGASVTLVHVIERGAPQAVHGERHLTDPAEAHAYLDEIARRAFPPGVQVERHVHTSEVANVARSIVEHLAEMAPDLIVMCTHGKSGLRELLFGSIAQQVVTRGDIPVLLIRPTAAGGDLPFTCSRLLVTLDGNPDHEQALSAAVTVAQACRAGLYLLLVVPTVGTLPGDQAATGRLLPSATAAMLELARQDAEPSLRRHVSRLQAQGLAVRAEVARGGRFDRVRDARQGRGGSLLVGQHRA